MKSLALIMTGALLAFTTACIDPRSIEKPEAPVKAEPPAESPPLPQGTYDVQSMRYDDANGLYQLVVLGAPNPMFQTTQLRMARISDEDVAAGKKTHLVVDAEGPTAMLTPDFKIEYVHNVVEERGGQPVVVRQETSSWSPFMMAMTGAMVGNMLFSPRYYYPPPYASGAPLGGFGGAGTSSALAQQDFAKNNGGALPQSAKLSKSGYAKAPSAGLKSTGSGAGSSRMKTTAPTPPKKSFGGGRGFGGRRR